MTDTEATAYDTCRASFRKTFNEAIEAYPRRVRFLDRWRVKRVFRRQDLSEILEEHCVEIGVAAGLILPSDLNDEGLLVKDWSSFFQMILDNLPAILEFISGLFAIFSMFSVVLAAGLALTLLAGSANAQCPNCAPRVVLRPVRSVLVRPVVVVEPKFVETGVSPGFLHTRIWRPFWRRR